MLGISAEEVGECHLRDFNGFPQGCMNAAAGGAAAACGGAPRWRRRAKHGWASLP